MHVCHFCEYSVESAYFENLTKGLIAKGVKISLLELGAHKPPKWLANVPEAEYFSLGIVGKSQYPRAVWRLAKFLKREKIDILQTHLYYAGLIGVLAKRLYRQTIIAMTRHHTSIVRMLGKEYHLVLEKWMSENADYVIAVSEATRNYMMQVDQIRGNHIEIAYIGFDFEKLKPNKTDRAKIRAEFGFGENDFVIGYVASFAQGKGHLQIIEAFSKIVKEIPEARLFFVGTGNSAEANAAVEKFSLREKIIFAGWRDDAPACMNAMDLFVQPSLSEAFSQVLIEAMGVGLPVIATDVGGANEVIADGKNGFLIKPNDAESIYRKTVELYRSKELRDKIAIAGQANVRKRFGVERMIERYVGLYQNWYEKKKKMSVSERLQVTNINEANKFSPYWGEHAARYIFALPYVEKKSVLDIACGTGYGIELLKGKAQSVTGVDIDFEAASQARKECDEKSFVLIGDGTNLPFADRSFDVVTSFETLEHLRDRGKFVSELKRVLRKDGVLILSTPNANYTKPVNGKPSNPFHIFEYKPEQLRAELARQFEVRDFLGQTLDESFTLSPFQLEQNRLPKDFSTQTKLFCWRVINKIPPSAREGLSKAIWKRPFYPTGNDYDFSVKKLENAPVLVAVCRKK
ncbi:MAG: glycosyltransferase [Pyrinomonadaceae bacterium]